MIGLLLPKKKTDKVLHIVHHRRKTTEDCSVYRDTSNRENILSDLSETSNKIFYSLGKKDFKIKNQLKYFKYDYKKATLVSFQNA